MAYNLKAAALLAARAGGRIILDDRGVCVQLRRDTGLRAVGMERRILWVDLESAKFNLLLYVQEDLEDKLDAATGKKEVLT